jgi:hypothetical protein
MTGNDIPSPAAKMAFWAAMLIGAVLRIYCVGFTAGTGDMDDWEDHAQQVRDRGLIGYYHANSFANHPPFISEVGSLILRASTATHVPFRILFRGLFALVDLGNALLLFSLLPSNRSRFLATAIYWISPAAIILSAYHGNTDTAVAFFLMLSIWLASKTRATLGGSAFGAGLWIKLPGILAFPAFMTFFRTWRSRIIFTLAATGAALITYLPALIQDYKVVWTNVFGYRGLVLQTTGGVPLWGPSVLLFSTIAGVDAWPASFLRPALFVLEQSWYLAIAGMFLLVWLRRNRHAPQELAATIAMTYVILLGFSDYWAFQYFAWSLPLWFFLPWRFSIPAVSLTSGYLYSLHWLFTGSIALQGGWDFGAHPTLPWPVLYLRDLAVAFFIVSALIFLAMAIRARPSSTSPEPT